tara:strand:+ start:13 stop:183 length:171 start_codon:yes stop_codon:yes gene_type:complete
MAEINEQVYIGDRAAENNIHHHAATFDRAMVIENAVLAGPVTFTKTVTVTGTLVVV